MKRRSDQDWGGRQSVVVTLIQSLLRFIRWSDVTLVVTKLDEQSVLLLDATNFRIGLQEGQIFRFGDCEREEVVEMWGEEFNNIIIALILTY